MSNPPSDIYKQLFGDPQALTQEQRAILDSIPIRGAAADALSADKPVAQRYSVDADPDGIRALVADAIHGALAFGFQGVKPPPEGHWLTMFWQMGRDALAAQPAAEPVASVPHVVAPHPELQNALFCYAAGYDGAAAILIRGWSALVAQVESEVARGDTPWAELLADADEWSTDDQGVPYHYSASLEDGYIAIYRISEGAAQPARAGGDAQDAARYRWLRSTTNSFTNSDGRKIDVKLSPAEFDAAVDAALAAAPQPAAAEPAKCKACGDTGLVRVWQKDENDRSGQSDYTAEDECPECMLSAKPMAVEQPAASTVPATQALREAFEGLDHVAVWTPEHSRTMPDQLRAYGDKRAREAVPKGWKLVPVEPTEEMLDAGRTAVMARDLSGPNFGPADHYRLGGYSIDGIPARLLEGKHRMSKSHGAALVYAAMLASAPTPGEKT